MKLTYFWRILTISNQRATAKRKKTTQAMPDDTHAKNKMLQSYTLLLALNIQQVNTNKYFPGKSLKNMLSHAQLNVRFKAQAFARVLTYLRYFSRALPLRAKLWSLEQLQRIFRQIDVCFVRSAIDALHPSQRLTTWHDTDRKISLI